MIDGIFEAVATNYVYKRPLKWYNEMHMKLNLIRRKTEAPDIESFIFSSTEPLTWKAGQFLHYVFIAGGIGITPFHSILKETDRAEIKQHVTLLYANRDHNIPYKEELEKFAKNNSNLIMHYVIAPERIDENTFKKLVPDMQTLVFYVSGPEPMVESLGGILKKMGIAVNHIKQDYFPASHTQ